MAFRAIGAGEYPEFGLWGSDEGSDVPFFCGRALVRDVGRDRADHGRTCGVEEEHFGWVEAQTDLLVHPGSPADHFGDCALAVHDGHRAAVVVKVLNGINEGRRGFTAAAITLSGFNDLSGFQRGSLGNVHLDGFTFPGGWPWHF